MNRHTRTTTLQGIAPAFTLIELLVVVSLIALLAAILAPSLANAREAGRRAVCLSNLHQLGTAMGTYFNTYDGYPIWSLWPRSSGRELWASYGFGGMTSSLRSHPAPFVRAVDRPLNRMLGAEVQSEPVPITRDEQRVEFPVYRCPSDRGDAFTRSQGVESTYAFFGTSYQFNYHWWQQALTRATNGRSIDWGANLFRRRAVREPSRFLLLEEEPLFTSIAAREERLGWHRRNRVHNALLLDGHAAPLTVRQDDLDRVPYPHAQTWTTFDETTPASSPRR